MRRRIKWTACDEDGPGIDVRHAHQRVLELVEVLVDQVGNAVGHFDDIAQMLYYLIKNDVIHRLDKAPGHSSQWVRSQS